jgi:CheY-like chemotaxis protein
VEDNEHILSVRKFLLMSDLIMPRMDGNELIRRAKQMHPGLPALLVSGTVTSFERAAAADAFLPKGACAPAEVLERIRILVARKRGPKKQVQSVRVAEVGREMAVAS